MQYAVEEVPVLTFTHAFNTLTPSTAADISQITNVAEWRFQTYVIAVDTAARYGLRAETSRGGWVLLHRDNTIWPNGTFVNLGDEQTINSVQNYSRLLAFKEQNDEMTLTNIKTPYNGTECYLFKYVTNRYPQSTTDFSYHEPPENALDYKQWTQTSNPLLSTSFLNATAVGNKSYGGAYGNSTTTNGLVLCNNHPYNMLNTLSKDDWWEGVHMKYYWNHPVGHNVGYPGIHPNANPTHLNVGYYKSYVNNLYVWIGPKPINLPTGRLTSVNNVF
jgi:hypothetical protein